MSQMITDMFHLSKALPHPGYSGVRFTRSLVLCVVFCGSLYVLFLLAIVLSVLLRFTDSDGPFGIFGLFLQQLLMDNSIWLEWSLVMTGCMVSH